MLSQSIREEFFCLAITFRTRRAFGRHPGRQALRLQLFGGEIRRPGESASESAVMPATKNRLITITHKLLLERKSFPASWRLIIRRSFQITSLAFSPLSRRTFGWKVSGRLTTSVLRPFGSLCFLVVRNVSNFRNQPCSKRLLMTATTSTMSVPLLVVQAPSR